MKVSGYSGKMVVQVFKINCTALIPTAFLSACNLPDLFPHIFAPPRGICENNAIMRCYSFSYSKC